MKKQNIEGTMRHAVERHQMISDGDFVAVGLSGGKDSMALLHLLKNFQRYSSHFFNLAAISIDLGFQKIGADSLLDFDIAQDFCDALDIPLHIIRTDIAEVVFEIRKEKNPCSLCATMRRGALASAMNRLGMNKLALGHHEGDLVATFLMNFTHGGRIKTLEPKSYLSQNGITVIRPILYVREKNILQYVRKNSIPVLKSPCPKDNKTARHDAEKIAQFLYQTNENAERSIIRAIKSILPDSEK